MAREGLPIILAAWIIVLIIAGLALYFQNRPMMIAAVVCVLLGLFVLYFFRDPQRAIPANPAAYVSPADGRVIQICEVDETEFIKGKALRISIFLSVFDVHVNRIPMGGTVRYKHYNKGKFLAAWNEKASLDNEQTAIGIECDGGTRILVKQIAGLIARRIVCHADSGMTFKTGDRFGLIRFGSRTDLFLPPESRLAVKVGDTVRGGSTIIGERK